jgi:hypothetical protein
MFSGRDTYFVLMAIYLVFSTYAILGKPKVDVDIGITTIRLYYKTLPGLIPIYLGFVQGILLSGIVFLARNQAGHKAMAVFIRNFFNHSMGTYAATFLLLYFFLFHWYIILLSPHEMRFRQLRVIFVITIICFVTLFQATLRSERGKPT